MKITNEMRVAVIKELLTPGSLEMARKRVEDELVEWRDSGLSILGRNNGLAIKYADGSPSSVIRFGFEDGFRIVLAERLAQLEHPTSIVEATSTNQHQLPTPPGDWCGDL